MILPSRINTGNHRLNDYLERMRRTVQSNVLNSGPTAFISRNQMGTVVSVPISRAIAASAGSSPSATFPIWKPYASPDEATDHASWWRTILVTQGTVNAQHPIGDGTAGGPYSDDSLIGGLTGDDLEDALDNSSIIIGGEAALTDAVTWHFYLKCTISTALDASVGKVTAVEIFAGVTWWPSYPDQPNGDGTTGAPPATFYIPLYDIRASADPDYTDGPYPAGTLTMPNVWSANSWWLDMVAFGNPTHDEDGNCIYQERMSQGAI